MNTGANERHEQKFLDTGRLEIERHDIPADPHALAVESVTTAGAPPVPGWSLRSDIHCLSFMVGGGGGSLPPVPAKGVAPDKKLFALIVCTGGAGGTSFPQARSIAGSLSVARLGVAKIARQRAAARSTLVMWVLSIRFERSCRPPVRAGKPGEPEAGPRQSLPPQSRPGSLADPVWEGR